MLTHCVTVSTLDTVIMFREEDHLKIIWGGGHTAWAQLYFYSRHSAHCLFETFFSNTFIYSSLLLAGFVLASDTLAESFLLQRDWSNQRGSIESRKLAIF